MGHWRSVEGGCGLLGRAGSCGSGFGEKAGFWSANRLIGRVNRHDGPGSHSIEDANLLDEWRRRRDGQLTTLLGGDEGDV